MPIEIKELVIKATVSNDIQGTSGSGSQTNSATGVRERDEIIATCVEQVLQILEDKEER